MVIRIPATVIGITFVAKDRLTNPDPQHILVTPCKRPCVLQPHAPEIANLIHIVISPAG